MRGRRADKSKTQNSTRGCNLACQAEGGWQPHSAGFWVARAPRSPSGGAREPEFELSQTWEASQHSTLAAARPRPPHRAPARSALQPRERARRRTNTGSSSSSDHRSPGKHQSDAGFQERAASSRSCRRTPAVDQRGEVSCCPAADQPPSPLPLPGPATSTASHRVGCLHCAPPTPSTLQ